jgi:hypothetical protein
MNKRKLLLIVFISLLIVELASLTVGLSALSNVAVIRTSGFISTSTTVETCSAADIQAAVDEIVANGGFGDVQLPSGTFNFVNVNEPITTVNIPAGINIFGAPTQRDANGQVTSWGTVLVVPWDAGGTMYTGWDSMFRFVGNGDSNKPSRFSDIKIQGYRTVDPDATKMFSGVSVSNVVDFRVDHCCFENVAGGAVSVSGLYAQGVIDHNKIYNTAGWDDLGGYWTSNVGYGVQLQGPLNAPFLPLTEVLGKYRGMTTFIEDNYFSRWRHVVASGHGAFYVFRYNTIDEDLGHYSLDVHGLRDTESGRAGGRGCEVYENTFTNVNQFIPGTSSPDYRAVMQNGGGCGVFFNNYIDNSYSANTIVLYSEDEVASDIWHLEDWYMWSGKGPLNPPTSHNGDIFSSERNVEAYWSRQAGDPSDPNYPNVDPSWSIAGYQPYQYPHPLTLP